MLHSDTVKPGLLIFLIVFALSLTVSGPALAQNYTVEQITPMHYSNEGSSTAVTTAQNGIIYSVWMGPEPNRALRIARIDPNNGYATQLKTVHPCK